MAALPVSMAALPVMNSIATVLVAQPSVISTVKINTPAGVLSISLMHLLRNIKKNKTAITSTFQMLKIPNHQYSFSFIFIYKSAKSGKMEAA